MEFNRSASSGQVRPSHAPAASAPAPQRPATTGSSNGDFKQSKLYKWSFIALLISGTLLFIATIFFIAFGRPLQREDRYVAKDKYQAVFVNVNGTNGGQVYFGKVAALTPQYIRLTDVFYIQNQSSGEQSSSSYNLVKLGCELHGPTDEMLINRSEVFFWENLKGDGQVAQKAAEWHKQNPNGQKCSAANNSGSTQQSNGTTQNASQSQSSTNNQSTGTPATTTPSTETTTKKQ
jgi:hypothetical protein